MADRKHRTRRQWSDGYAERLAKKVPFPADAWDHLPRVRPVFVAKGLPPPRKVADIRLLGIRKEDIALMPDSDFELEGFAYLKEQGMLIWGRDPWDAFTDWRARGGVYWVVDLRLLRVVPA